MGALWAACVLIACSEEDSKPAGSGSPDAGGTSSGGAASTGGADAGGAGALAGSAGTDGAADAEAEAGCADGTTACSGGCTDVTRDAKNCGACGTSCASHQFCQMGTCVACPSGDQDCNADGADGCEVASTWNNSSHCGFCNHDCSKLPNVTSAWCEGNVCKFQGCAAPFASCQNPSPQIGGEDFDGCETDLTKPGKYCGSCAYTCFQFYAPALTCMDDFICGCKTSDQCWSGAGGAAACTSAGACSCGGTTCARGEKCRLSGSTLVCSCRDGEACPPGKTCCAPSGGPEAPLCDTGGGALCCKDLSSDPFNCGGCARACPAGKACVAGACQ